MIIWDTETTGLITSKALPLDKQPQIIEFAGIKLDDKTLKEVDRLEFLCHPGKPLPAEIVKITGIDDGMLKGKPAFSANYDRLAQFYLGERIHIAHNIAYDMGMLEFELARLGLLSRFPWPMNPICTVEQTMHIRGHRLNLTKLHNHCFGKDFPSAHRAMADVEALTKCAIWLIQNGHIELPN